MTIGLVWRHDTAVFTSTGYISIVNTVVFTHIAITPEQKCWRRNERCISLFELPSFYGENIS